MRIKTLQINGFKSFVDRSVLAFQPGISAIVGPNGCGKSNVVDAMRWAMGEQSPRHLRGKAMEDIIFAGSEVRQAVGMAEVVLTFDNSDGRAPAAYAGFTEIQVGRRLYRTGESEYLINKTPCRLRDVLDFFRDTGIGTRGYTIVEQGQIASIVSAKPDERRQLIEEAAGISKYKARRREAESKLKSTEQNLLRVSDVLAEIKRQIASLERQARKAARYKRLRERQRLLELSLAADDRRTLGSEIAAGQERLAAQREASGAAESRLSEREADLERLRLELAERERAVVQGSERLFALRSEIKQHESRIEYEQRERATLAETRESRQQELATLREQLATAQGEERALAEELAQLEGELRGEAESLEALEAEARQAAESVRTQEGEREAASARLLDVLTAMARAEDRVAALEDRRGEMTRRLRSTDEQLEVQQSEANRVDDEQRRLEEGLRNLLAERDRLMLALRDAIERHERTAAGVREAGERERQAREHRDLRHARLASLREVMESHEDLAAGTRHLLGQSEESRRTQGIRALVRDVVEADPELERAVEAALRERAEGLAVSGLDGALAALEALHRAEAGSAVFVMPPPGDPAPSGFVPLGEPLLDRVRVRAGFEALGRTLLGGVNLVSDLGEVLRIYGQGTLPATFVTARGDVLTPDGVLRGGGRAPGVLARAREVRDLEAEVASLDVELASQEAARAAAEEAAARASDEVDNLRNRHHTAALAVASHEKDLERTRERVKALGEAQEGRAAERSTLVSETETLEGDRSELESRLEQLRADRGELQRTLDGLATRIGQCTREQQRQDTLVTERRVGHASRVEKRDRLVESRARADAATAEAQSWIQRREREIDEMEARRSELTRSTEEAQVRLAQLLRDEEAARAEADGARDQYEECAAGARQREDEARSLRAEMLAARERVQAVELEIREANLRLEQLDARVRDRWEVELATWTPPPVAETPPPTALAAAAEGEADAERDGDAEDEDAEAATISRSDAELVELPRAERERHLEDARKRLQGLGEVNLGAIEEHEELGERFRFLTEQKDDLETTVTQLREAIARINRTSRRRFRETFEAVNARFQENFPRLFRGGKASLALTESDDVLEAGVDIMAQPPGKRLQNVSLLSGGEKTLTALSLLVSLFQVHPSPFFLLDEVDAALDDANVGRLNEIVREMSDQSQFLVITHNKATIEIADVLYGVTMEEKGVSKVVSVELRED
ncbi:MAG: chromosome segregation protein SMC [Myxococcota bacterium]|nr:chromosome segregation protein SMC [Myxococcota bacterium]